MKKVLSSVTDEMLEALFLKVDSDCDGSVSWQKYVDFMMRELRVKEETRKNQYRLHFYLPMRIIHLNHGCEIVKVEYLIQRFKKSGVFLTITKDGILQFWTEAFSIISSFRLKDLQKLHKQQIWVIDMVCLHNMNLIAVASTDLKIEFFDISNHNCVRAFTFFDLDSCVLVMDYWSDYQRGVFCYGDTKGNVIIFTSDDVTSGLFNPSLFPKTTRFEILSNISLRKLLKEKSTLYKSYRLRAVHTNWCEQVKFIPRLNVVASCSATEKSSLVMIILPPSDSERPNPDCGPQVADTHFLALVTGGYDPHIRLWNPLISKKPVWLMKGHQTSVTHIIMKSENSIFISISRDKVLAYGEHIPTSSLENGGRNLAQPNIRVWDLQDYECLQSFGGKTFALGNCAITSAYLHKDNTLVCSTYSIGILKGYLETQEPIKAGPKTTHSTALCAVLYSKIVKQVVSGCLHGEVSVWDVKTGKKKMEFSVTSTQPMELTAMALDESGRCLLTGLRDGTMMMWNHSTGECLLTFPNPDQMEVQEPLIEGLESNGDLKEQKWAYRPFLQASEANFKTLSNAILRQSLTSAPPAMRRDEHGSVLQIPPSTSRIRLTKKSHSRYVPYTETERKKGEFKTKLMMQSSTSVEKIIFLQTRSRLPHTAALLSSCVNGYIYAWSIHGSGGLMGKFPVDSDNSGSVTVSTMATDEDDCILITGDSKGKIRIWDIKDYCIFVGHPSTPHSVKYSSEIQNKFPDLMLSPQISTPYYVPLKEKEVVEGQSISLVPPKLLITWKGHSDNVTDVMYVDSFQLVISAGQDCNVKAWKLSGDAVGTFGLNVWKRLQDATMDSGYKQAENSEEEDIIDSVSKAPQPDLQRDLYEALAYQRREQAVLMDLLNQRPEKEAEAWAKLQKMAVTSPWPREHSPQDIEESWNKWESHGKQLSEVLGAFYKPKEHSRTGRFLTTSVNYGCMKQQISPLIYHSLYVNELEPTQQLPNVNLLTFKITEPQVQRIIHWDDESTPKQPPPPPALPSPLCPLPPRHQSCWTPCLPH
ncbi:PREDICTED: EF-hand calcium-binding domain-containing protein 8 [Dipodomys ordii]|uniref:WD repeat-containing protein on Y chromosome n=1 Tax=Dipodomys ordii TaxID=10020 RepID=A0A1S3EP39_DIPOR|nr:PREDICTED: EF-hand calcium-binding domain-containing protein 8 [Dipodomys ordii]